MRKPSKIQLGLLVFLLLAIALVLVIVWSYEPIQEAAPVREVVPVKQLSEQEQIKMLVAEQLEGINNRDKPYIREIDVVKQIGGGWGVFVEYNASDNIARFRRFDIEVKMSEVYIALYTSYYDIRVVSISAYFPLVDRYGHVRDAIVYRSILDREVAVEVNWDAHRSLLKVDILPGVWTISILHSEFRGL